MVCLKLPLALSDFQAPFIQEVKIQDAKNANTKIVMFFCFLQSGPPNFGSERPDSAMR